METFLQRREKIAAAFLTALFFLLNLSIASRSPFGGWMDEVVFVDPAFNLAVGKGWTSSAWSLQTDHEFWAVNSPFYSGGLFLWVHLFGISMVAARSYCYFLFAIGLFLFWLGTFRFNLLTPAYRLFWLVFLSTEYAMNWMERNERYDVWIFVALALTWFGASLRTTFARCIMVFTGSLLVPCGGFVAGPYLILLAAFATILTGFKFWKEAIIAVMGDISGVIAVCLFFLSFGQLGTFFHQIHLTAGLGDRPFYTNLRQIFLYPTDDPWLIIMIGVLVALTIFYARQGILPAVARWLGLGWGIVLLMPCLMMMRGVFAMMYFYMVIIPLSLALLQLIQKAQSSQAGRRSGYVMFVVMALTCLGGLPARLYTSLKEWDLRNPEHMRDFVHQYIRPDDAVLADYAFYFVLRDYAGFIATPEYARAIPPDEASRINVALVIEDLTRDISSAGKIGGGWKKIAVFPTPEMTAHLKPGTSYRKFTLYRREVPLH